ncbi:MULTISPECIES: recombinase family protein [Comamonas]|uniref:recombinase family protein n=1 Tax=Comamonas TaxID=283 RepID=UPI002580BB4A|nr:MULTISPECIES: recombinase family protein [Comamonas]
MKPRVISYTRFSSQRQSKGRSEERQTDAARDWCEQHGLELDENIQDLGISAFTGKHRKKGNLRAFLEQVEAGKVQKGSYLLVEHFDRLTREEIDEADTLVKSILRKGVNIVTLLDGHIYTQKSLNNIAALISMILAFGQAHEESFRKGGRVSDTFKKKRAEGKRVFGAAPGWLERGEKGKDGEWVVVPELAAVVIKVFELAASGLGGPSIAKIANKEGWPIPTRQTKISTKIWHSKMPQIILRNRAVLGETQHVIRGRNALKKLGVEEPVPAGPPIKNYYPRIISDELWYKAKGSIQSRKTVPMKRDRNYFNIWAGLLKCGCCGANMERKTETKGYSRAQIICKSKMAGLTKCKTASALKTDATILRTMCAAAGEQLGLGYDKQEAIDKITIAKGKLEDIKKELENVIALSRAVGAIPEVLKEIEKLTKERSDLEAGIQEINQTLALEPNSMFDTKYADEIIELLYTESNEAMIKRAECNAKLRRAVECIWLWSYDLAAVKFKGNNVLLTIPLIRKAKGDKQAAWEAAQAGTLELP